MQKKNVTGKSSTLTSVYLCRNDVSPWICHDAVFSAADLERTPLSRRYKMRCLSKIDPERSLL